MFYRILAKWSKALIENFGTDIIPVLPPIVITKFVLLFFKLLLNSPG